jgi:hypothetical protein
MEASHEMLKCETRTGTEYFKSFFWTISGGGDRTVMLRLYQALIRSKIDYGSFVYGSTKKSRLCVLDHVRSAALRLATGAFRTSRLESLYAESGDPPLTVRRNIFSATVSQCWQRNPRIPHTELWSAPPPAAGTIF